MNSKKLILTAAAFILACGTVASAADSVTATTNGNTVTISGTTDASVVTVKVMPEGASESDITNLYEIKEVNVTNGAYSYSFDMPDRFNSVDVDGNFTVYAFGTEKQSKTFDYVSATTRQTFASSFTGKTTDEIKDIFAEPTNERLFASLGMDVSFYADQNFDKDSFAAFLVSEIGSETVSDVNLSSFVTKAEVLESAKTTNVDSNLLEKSGMTFEGNTIDKETDSNKQTWIASYVNAKKPYANSEDMQKAYTEAGVLYKLQTAKYTDYDDIINTYDAQIQIKSTTAYTTYAAFGDVYKSNVNEIVKASASTFTSFENFRTAFGNAVTSVVNGASASNPGGGSYGGGSYGYNGATTKNDSTNVVVSPSVSEEVSISQNTKSFSDVEDEHWASEAVEMLASKGIVSGYEDETFKPDNSVTREEFVKMIVATLGLEKGSKENDFTDVEADKWYTEYIDIAVGKELVSGREDGTFGVGEKITREEMAVIVRRAIQEVSNVRTYVEFSDADQISEFAKDAVKDLYCAGIINGITESEFSPKSYVTRAQAAKVLYDAFVK